jgi:adenylate cyclase, class 2
MHSSPFPADRAHGAAGLAGAIDSPLARNIELKARLASFEAARATAARLATDPPGLETQVDTYFVCRHGRLKLREINGVRAQLVWYARSDRPDAKASDYWLVNVPEPKPLKQALAAAWGTLVVVEKRREIYLHHNVRIHLDEVTGLGEFIEFEAVLGPGVDEAGGQAQVAWLQDEFRIAPADLLEGSYSDLLQKKIEC